MARIGIGLPMGKRESLTRQKTIDGITYQIRPKYYYGAVCGWTIYENGNKVRFTLADPIGIGISPKKILEEHIKWALIEKEVEGI